MRRYCLRRSRVVVWHLHTLLARQMDLQAAYGGIHHSHTETQHAPDSLVRGEVPVILVPVNLIQPEVDVASDRLGLVVDDALQDVLVG